MDISPVVLAGQHVRLEPLDAGHGEALLGAAADGELWNLKVTTVPSSATMPAYLDAALRDCAARLSLPFVIVDVKSANIVGSTRYLHIEAKHRRVEIGSTWLAVSAQRTRLNTEAKLLLLAHAFEVWRCHRVELVTDVLNIASRNAIIRIGASEEGILRQHMVMPDGRIRDSVMHSIVADEWPQKKARLLRMLG